MNQLPQETEAEFQEAVIQLAQLRGWKVAHFRAARTATDWRTAVAADGAGFPDLVMVRGARLLFIELKSDSGRLSAAQHSWLDALSGLDIKSGVLVDTWRPADWPAIEHILR